MSEKKINPQIRKVNIGIRELRSISIYPLSMADQMKMVDLIKGIFGSVYEVTQKDAVSSVEIADVVIEKIKEHLPKLLQFVTDEEIFLEELTNFQFTEIVGHVYKDNFEDASKNVKGLVESMKKVSKFTG
jgi:hypothetical protein